MPLICPLPSHSFSFVAAAGEWNCKGASPKPSSADCVRRRARWPGEACRWVPADGHRGATVIACARNMTDWKSAIRCRRPFALSFLACDKPNVDEFARPFQGIASRRDRYHIRGMMPVLGLRVCHDLVNDRSTQCKTRLRRWISCTHGGRYRTGEPIFSLWQSQSAIRAKLTDVT